MANFTKAMTKNFLDSVLPTFGQPRVNIPVWDESQKMFLCDQYQSAAGHLYYKGVRFCDRFAVVEKVGHYYIWTYIDGIEIYAFNGKKPELVQQRQYDKVYRDEDFIRTETAAMLRDYLAAMSKAQHVAFEAAELEAKAKELVDRSYKSFLDTDYSPRLTQIMPKLLNQ